MDLYEGALGSKERSILNVPVRVQTFTQAAQCLDAAFSENRQTVVAFANAHTLTLARVNASFRAALQESVVLNDGVGVDLASRLLYGTPFPENLNGTDFVPRYLLETRHCYRIFLLGAKPGVAARAAQRLSELYPHHEIVGHHHGFFGSGEAAGVIETIRSTGANVVLVALGNPGQELWLQKHLTDTGCTLGFGVGALFDFLTGEVPRASPWIRRLRFEWAYRLMQEPTRLAVRYLIGNPLFLCQVFRQYLSGQRISTPGRP
jgi:alpha-1,3-mannosyltransferase